MRENRLIVMLLSVIFLLLFIAGYIYILKKHPPEIPVTEQPLEVSESSSKASGEEYTTVKIFYPNGAKLVMEEREIKRVFSQKKILKMVLHEFLKGLEGAERNIIPEDSLLLGIFIGNDGIAYINFSEEFRRNFHGDIIDEYLLLKGIYESTMTNIRVDNVRILIENKEVDTIGGHFLADRPLKQLVTQEFKLE